MLSGPDQVPAFLIKDFAGIFVGPLCYLCNLSWKCFQFPDVWKVSRIVPVLNDPTLIPNYRQIAITSNLSKVFIVVICSTVVSLP